MKNIHPIVQKWINCWETGKIEDLPITEDFSHTSPFGTIAPKSKYMDIVRKNQKDFLGNTLTVIRQIYEDNNVCIQFKQHNENTGLDMMVCEWYIIEGDLIKEIQAFYNIGDAVING